MTHDEVAQIVSPILTDADRSTVAKLEPDSVMLVCPDPGPLAVACDMTGASKENWSSRVPISPAFSMTTSCAVYAVLTTAAEWQITTDEVVQLDVAHSVGKR